MRDVERAMKDIENEAAQTENAVEQLFGARPRRPSKGARRILGPVLHRRSIRRMSRERDFDGLAAALVSRDPLLAGRRQSRSVAWAIHRSCPLCSACTTLRLLGEVRAAS